MDSRALKFYFNNLWDELHEINGCYLHYWNDDGWWLFYAYSYSHCEGLSISMREYICMKWEASIGIKIWCRRLLLRQIRKVTICVWNDLASKEITNVHFNWGKGIICARCIKIQWYIFARAISQNSRVTDGVVIKCRWTLTIFFLQRSRSLKLNCQTQYVFFLWT